jgi:DNA-binding SARP family transcriptional activator
VLSDEAGTRVGLAPVTAHIHISLLGSFRLSRAGLAIPLPIQCQRLLALLGLTNRMSRSTTSYMLRPDASEQHAMGSLRSAIWRLNRACPGALQSTRDCLDLTQSVTVDVRQLTDVVRQILRQPEDLAAKELAHGALSTELLPGWYDDWILTERERLRQLRLRALEACAENLLERAHYALALEVAQAAVRSEPLRESAHRLTLRILLAQGNRAEAVRQFDLFRRLLAAEIGLEPCQQTWHLVADETRATMSLQP